MTWQKLWAGFAEVEHRRIGVNFGDDAFPLIDIQCVVDHALAQQAAAKAAAEGKTEKKVK